jgi:hypothetical protein
MLRVRAQREKIASNNVGCREAAKCLMPKAVQIHGIVMPAKLGTDVPRIGRLLLTNFNAEKLE